MTSMLFCIFLALFVSFPKAHCQDLPDQIIEIFRHGARGVLDDNYDSTWSLDEFGELTPVGMRQHYILGKALAKKYPNLLGSNYNLSEIYVLSDKTPRCIQSAQAHLYGIYLGSGPSLNNSYPPELAVPPFQDPIIQEIAKSLGDSASLPHNYVPPIIQVINVSNGFTFQSDDSTYCPNDNLWTDKNLNSTKLNLGMKIFEPTLMNINAYYNNSLTISDMSDVWDDIEVDLADNRPNPAGINNSELINNFTYANSWLSMYTYLNQKVQRQVAGFGLINAIIGQLTSFRQGESFNTVAMYSGHDGDIWAILGAFGIVTEDCLMENFKSYLANSTTPYPNCYYPGFASNFIIEFYNSTKAPYVKLYYNNVIVPLCNGQDSCTYDEFIFLANNATGNSTVQDYFRKCGTNMTELMNAAAAASVTLVSQGEGPMMLIKSKITVEILIILGLAILIGALFVKVISDKKRYDNKYNELLHERMLYSEDSHARVHLNN